MHFGRGVSSLVLVAGCSSNPSVAPNDGAGDAMGDGASSPQQRKLGLNDVSILLPLPVDTTTTSFVKMTGFTPNADLIPRAVYTRVATDHEDVTNAFEEFHAVAIRFDLCDRVAPGPCPSGVDGQIRIVFQPLIADSFVRAADVALHATYPVPAADVAGMVDELRALGELLGFPLTSRLTIHSGFSSTAPPSPYTTRMKALIQRYASAANLFRLTLFAQDARSRPGSWALRGLEQSGDAFVDITIPTIQATEQAAFIYDNGGLNYFATPIGDVPAGFQLALQADPFSDATVAERTVAVKALAAAQNPMLTTFQNTQCINCHVTTVLTHDRADIMNIAIESIPDTFTSTHDLSIESGESLIWPQALRAFGYFINDPIISQRVANESGMVVDEIEAQFPPHAVSPPTDAGVPDGPVVKRVFLTNAIHHGDFKTQGNGIDGLDGADRVCTTAATVAQLGGEWEAWLSTGTVNAIDHISGVGPWFLVDGATMVFPDKAGLLTGPLVPIDRDQFGGYPAGADNVWSGSTAAGTVMSGLTCADWTSNAFNAAGHMGLRSSTTSSWSDHSDVACNSVFTRLYCFER